MQQGPVTGRSGGGEGAGKTEGDSGGLDTGCVRGDPLWVPLWVIRGPRKRRTDTRSEKRSAKALDSQLCFCNGSRRVVDLAPREGLATEGFNGFTRIWTEPLPPWAAHFGDVICPQAHR